MRARTGIRLVAAGAVLAMLATPGVAMARPAQAPPDEGQLSAAVIAQINDLQAEKASRTPAERKVDSHLLHAARQATGQREAVAVPERAGSVASAADGRTEVDIRATVSDRLLDRIESLGGTVVTSVASYDAIRARIPLSAVGPLSQDTAVRSIGPAEQGMTNRIDQVTDAVASFDPGQPNVGAVTAEGDATHQADDARTNFGIDGTGVTIGVLSDGVSSLAARQASGDLPAVTVLAAGSGDEGTAMLEIVHDLAPGATLLFATANGGQGTFATNIIALRTAGADIIVDDFTYFAESVFQPGIIEQAVDQVVADGAVYFSSAGNSGNLPDGTSGTWTGDFVSAGPAGGILSGAGLMLDWDQTAGTDATISLATNTGNTVGLAWADPLGASGNDYDIYVLNAAGTAIVDAATNVQDGNDDPQEFLGTAFAGEQFVVALFAGAPRYISVATNRGRFAEHGTGGATYGHNSGENTISVAAAPANTAFAAGWPTGPFPGPFTNANQTEFFSSDGPRRNFFETDGTPIAGGEVLTKPDITAADGVATTTPGFIPFFGTSAAAPHAAAIAALMMDAAPTLTGPQIRAAVEASTIDIEAVGDDNVTGTGILMALDAVALVSPLGTAQFDSTTYFANEVSLGATITIHRTDTSGPASIQLAVAAGGTATAGSDYTFPAPVTVSWLAGDASDKAVNFPLVDDADIEGVETVNLVLQNPTGTGLGVPSTATLSILDDDSPAPGSVQFSSTSYSTGEVGPTATITVNRTGGADGAASVQVALAAGGTATNGSDFTYASPQTVSWPDGVMGARTVTITIHQDTVDEPNETVNLALQNATGAVLGSPTTSVLTIVDDDAAAPPPGPPGPPGPPSPPPPPPTPTRDVTRIAGEDRIDTAIAASQEAFGTGAAGTVVVARSDAFADALVGVPLAAAGNGPLLLTPPTGLDDRVLDEIRRVLPAGGSVSVLGGTTALAGGVVTSLEGAGFDVERLFGETRFETAVAVAGALGSPTEVYVATGRNFPDALAAGAAAAAHDGAVLLTDDETVPASVATYLGGAGVHAIAVGGPAARALPAVQQVVGENRYATAVLLAAEAFDDVAVVGIATGENFPDALSGGAHIAHHGGPLLLTPGIRLDTGVATYIGAFDPAKVFLYGGTAALSESVAEAAATA